MQFAIRVRWLAVEFFITRIIILGKSVLGSFQVVVDSLCGFWSLDNRRGTKIQAKLAGKNNNIVLSFSVK